MDGWMDPWIHGYIDGLMNEWVDPWLHGYMVESMDAWIDGHSCCTSTDFITTSQLGQATPGQARLGFVAQLVVVLTLHVQRKSVQQVPATVAVI